MEVDADVLHLCESSELGGNKLTFFRLPLESTPRTCWSTTKRILTPTWIKFDPYWRLATGTPTTMTETFRRDAFSRSR